MLALACVLSFGIIHVLSRYPAQMLEARGFFTMVMHLFSIYGVFRLRFPAAAACGSGERAVGDRQRASGPARVRHHTLSRLATIMPA